MTLLSTETTQPHARPATRSALEISQHEGSGVWPWVWMGIACTLLTFFSMVRTWQDGRDQFATTQKAELPFSLALIPKTLGVEDVWTVNETAKLERLEGTTLAITGAIGEPLERVYYHKETGVTLAVLVLFGPAEKVTGHIPEICYPAAGFELAESIDLKIDDKPIEYRSLLFAKKGGTIAQRDEVCYTFRQAGTWSPKVSGNWKTLQSGPPVFKIQIQRRVTEHEHRGINNPCQQFLDVIISEIDTLIRSGKPDVGSPSLSASGTATRTK